MTAKVQATNFSGHKIYVCLMTKELEFLGRLAREGPSVKARGKLHSCLVRPGIQSCVIYAQPLLVHSQI